MSTSKKPSEFLKLFEAQKDETTEPEQTPLPVQTQPVQPLQPVQPTPVEQKRGRAKGKRSDPNYTQVGAYIPKELDKAVKRKLLDTDQDFSELVADLLTKWLSG